jgi:hypothetical protein
LIIEKRGEDKTNLATAQQGRETAEKSTKEAQAKLTVAQAATADVTTKLTAATSKADDLNNQLTAAQKDAADAKSAEQTAKDAATAAQGKVDQMTKDLDGHTVPEYKAMVDKAQKDSADAQTELKIAQDAKEASDEHVKQLIVDINNRNSKTEPPGVSGKVTFVDRTWNFVVLDVGLDAGVVPNGELIVYRGRTFLGKIRVTRADPKDAVAEILPDVKGNIQVGDAVLN